MSSKTGSDLFIVDNSEEEWKVLNYLSEWTEISSRFDIATGYFEIGSLLALDGKWQRLEQIRILMGDEVTKRTHRALLEGVARIADMLDDSIEQEKAKNDFLSGVPAIVRALVDGRILCRVYAKKKFHAKAYITHSKLAVVGSSALVGSSNFTAKGLTSTGNLRNAQHHCTRKRSSTTFTRFCTVPLTDNATLGFCAPISRASRSRDRARYSTRWLYWASNSCNGTCWNTQRLSRSPPRRFRLA